MGKRSKNGTCDVIASKYIATIPQPVGLEFVAGKKKVEHNFILATKNARCCKVRDRISNGNRCKVLYCMLIVVTGQIDCMASMVAGSGHSLAAAQLMPATSVAGLELPPLC